MNIKDQFIKEVHKVGKKAKSILKTVISKYHSNYHSLPGAMQEVLESRAEDPRLKAWAPWRPFPNVRDFKVELSL